MAQRQSDQRSMLSGQECMSRRFSLRDILKKTFPKGQYHFEVIIARHFDKITSSEQYRLSLLLVVCRNHSAAEEVQEAHISLCLG